ncbi:expressed unknown protein [Seminavis robusta]|uniref:Uncharacterized protein n=1 Tax=Seminavis robusta TaxID=568900 RepID=A0A9N8EGR9_9STRA|nr:expressed unknown protein [Seminavis robusta]|eukprot:Sro922_g220530.1 n/a (109) ;mRNA; r:15398-15724
MPSSCTTTPCEQEVFESAWRGNTEELKQLLQAGGNANARGETSWRGSEKYTALQIACNQGHCQCVQALLECGAQVDTPEDGAGWTPLVGLAEPTWSGYFSKQEPMQTQ